MHRNIQKISNSTYDIIVVGGGIYGACLTRDAALRGLRVLLLERNDFGSETSHNSLKIIHGGIRYIQHLDLPRIISSIRERRAWLRIAPHLVRPLGFLIPTYNKLLRGKFALCIAIRLHEVIGLFRNYGVLKGSKIARGRIYSKRKMNSILPGVMKSKVNGGALWYDAQVVEANRAILEIIMQATKNKADVANYAEVVDYVYDGGKVEGVVFIDKESDSRIQVHSSIVINACGAWYSDLLSKINNKYIQPDIVFSKGMNIVTRSFNKEFSFGAMSDRLSDSVISQDKRLFFFTPWKGLTIIGTSHAEYRGKADKCSFSREEVEEFIEEINQSYPDANLSFDDIYYVYGGLTPAEDSEEQDEVKRSRSVEIIDHQKTDNIQGLITVIGVKYTTARAISEKVIDLATKRLYKKKVKCVTDKLILERPPIDYSNNYNLLSRSEQDKMIEYFVNHEMAIKLSDIFIRRIDISARGLLTHECIDITADLMQKKLSWSDERKSREINDFNLELDKHHAKVI